MRYKAWIMFFTALGGLGGVACILQWLEIKPRDIWGWQVSLTLPHWLWLVMAFVLFGVSLGTAGFAVLKQGRELEHLRQAPSEQMEAQLLEQAGALKRLPVHLGTIRLLPPLEICE